MKQGPEGTRGYSDQADQLVSAYEGLLFEDVHRETVHLFPLPPAQVLDVGAGTGRDAAALSRIGHRVVAVEPTPELRAAGERLHCDVEIMWVDDALPELHRVSRPEGGFDLILLTAVWMHLDPDARGTAMARLAELLAASGLVAITLRHGPVPPGRRMFDVTGTETAALGARHGLSVIHESEREDFYSRGDVSWTCLALARTEWRAPR